MFPEFPKLMLPVDDQRLCSCVFAGAWGIPHPDGNIPIGIIEVVVFNFYLSS